jgi:hypothetical protein
MYALWTITHEQITGYIQILNIFYRLKPLLYSSIIKYFFHDPNTTYIFNSIMYQYLEQWGNTRTYKGIKPLIWKLMSLWRHENINISRLELQMVQNYALQLTLESQYISLSTPQNNSGHLILVMTLNIQGMQQHSWLRHYATSWKVACSFPDEVTGFFNWPNPSSCTTELGSTQPLTELSTRKLPEGEVWPVCKADNLTATCVPTV